MLFNSYPFIFLFLPVTLLVFFKLGTAGRRGLAAAWLAAASLAFYGWIDVTYVPLLLGSILCNFLLGRTISVAETPRRRLILILAVTGNLALLGYFKYANFLLGSLGGEASVGLNLGGIVLPPGVSFFTFTQIAFLVDTYRGEVKGYPFLHYGLFVSFFPHLIAGPIYHHREIAPQFSKPGIYRLNHEDCAVGLTIFSIGLFKKVVLADNVGRFSSPMFDAAAHGVQVTLFEAWGGALAYTLQLYFDFSGYSDMAIGLARLFGVRFPLNFNSPYKAASIIEFWRRWHMTLTRFLRDYIYIPLGGNRRGPWRRYGNVIITMVLAGLWHGAGWTFVVWGALHGGYLVVNHVWQDLRRRFGLELSRKSLGGIWLGRVLTFLAVVVGWVVFRADDLGTAASVLKAMAGEYGCVLPEQWLHTRLAGMDWLIRWLSGYGVVFGDSGTFVGLGEVAWLAGLLAVVWLLPNTQELFGEARLAIRGESGMEAEPGPWQWRPTWIWGVFALSMFLAGVTFMNRASEFLYFQF